MIIIGSNYTKFSAESNFITGEIGSVQGTQNSSYFYVRVNRLSGGGSITGYDQVKALEGNLFNISMTADNDPMSETQSLGSLDFDSSMVIWSIFAGVTIIVFGVMVYAITSSSRDLPAGSWLRRINQLTINVTDWLEVTDDAALVTEFPFATEYLKFLKHLGRTTVLITCFMIVTTVIIFAAFKVNDNDLHYRTHVDTYGIDIIITFLDTSVIRFPVF